VTSRMYRAAEDLHRDQNDRRLATLLGAREIAGIRHRDFYLTSTGGEP